MKKIVSLILALIMCLSLCACGGGKTESTPTPTSNGSTNENPTTTDVETTADVPTEVIETTTPAPADHPLLSQLCGEWVLYIPNDDAIFTSITIHQDGNCIVDGVSATWKYPNHDTDLLYIEVYNGTEMICGVMLYDTGDGMTINGCDTDGWACPGIYEKVS